MSHQDASKRQGLRLTGRLADVERAVLRVMNSRDLGRGFHGMAVYAEDRKRPDELSVLFQNSHNATPDHREFVADTLVRRRLLKDGTSVGQALRENNSGMYASGFAAHDCLNVIGVTPSGRYVLQFVFARGASPVLDHPDDFLYMKGLEFSVDEAVRSLLLDYRDDLSDRLDLRPPINPNGVLLFSDISGYTSIARNEGEHIAFRQTDTLLAAVTGITKKFGGTVIREEGDGIWCGFSEFDERAVQVAREIQQAHRIIRNADPSETVKKSRIRTAIATGYMEGVLRGAVFHPDIKYNSLAFITARMMSAASPRDRDFIALSPQAAKLLSGFDESADITVPVHSTYLPEMIDIS